MVRRRGTIIIDSFFTSRWVAVDNLLVEVRVAFELNAADEARVASVTQALRDDPQP